MTLAPTRALAGTHKALLPRLKVLVTAGSQKGVAVDLREGPLVVGKDSSCDLVLEDDSVSARHCELTLERTGVMVRDLGSTNGTFLEGVRILAAFAEPGSKVLVGETPLRLKADADEEVLLSSADHFGRLRGDGPYMRALFAQLEKVAESEAPLLIEGETGTGKDVTAEAVHGASSRKQGPFILVDCGAMAGNLLEAELFGYEKGAFTGAVQSKVGLAEAADGGTLVLDEIGEMPLELQPKLLRLVERREVRPLGSSLTTTVDVRIISCTHRSLRQEVKSGRFREDLFYRLSALRVRLPALRERREDLPLLVDTLLERQGSKRRFADLPHGDQEMLRSHRWPGNIRELRNFVERLIAFESLPASRLLEQELITDGNLESTPPSLYTARAQTLDAFERAYLRRVLTQAGDSVVEAARLAGVSRQFLHRLIKKHGLRDSGA